MSYEEYENIVKEALDAWSDVAKRSSTRKAAPYKQSAEDLIAEWKNSFPRRKEKISAFVSSYLSRKFNT